MHFISSAKSLLGCSTLGPSEIFNLVICFSKPILEHLCCSISAAILGCQINSMKWDPLLLGNYYQDTGEAHPVTQMMQLHDDRGRWRTLKPREDGEHSCCCDCAPTAV